MERMQEMIDHIKASIEDAVNNRKQLWNQLDATEAKTEIQTFLEGLDNRNGNLVLTYLKSSYITGSHSFKIAIYEDEPFTQLYPPHAYLNMKALFLNGEKELDVFTKQLKQKFTRIMDSELEEIRRYYLELLYIASIAFFQRIFSELQQQIELPPIFFGAELSEVTLIGGI